MDAGFLQVLHDAADEEVGAVVQGVHIELDRVVEEPVDQERLALLDHDLAGRPHEVVAQRIGAVDDLHAATAEHEARAHEHGVADLLGDAHRALHVDRRAVARRQQPGLVEQSREQLALLGQVDGLRARPQDRVAGRLDALREPERGLAAELADDAEDGAARRLRVQDLQDVLERQRLEVQPVGRVVVGRHGLRVAVDHHGLEARVRQRERGVHAGVVELDALTDAVRAGADDDDLGAVRRRDLGLGVVARVVVRRQRGNSPRRCRPSCRRGGFPGRGARRGSRPRSRRGAGRSARRRSRAPWRSAASRRPARRRCARPRRPR